MEKTAMRWSAVLLFVMHASCVAAALFTARSAEARDEAIELAQAVYDRDDGRDSAARVIMMLIDSDNDERRRTLEIRAKDYGELTKRQIVFTSPKSIEGTAFLSLENYERGDDQFLYLPSLRRVRRIVSDQKDKSFVNTDFSYEDLERRKVEDFTHRITGRERIIGRETAVLESVPRKAEHSQYEKIVSWIDLQSRVPLKVDYYKRGEKVKTLTVAEIKIVDGIWTATDTLMHDLTEDHKTRMQIEEVKYNKGVSDQVFSEHYLEQQQR